MIPIGYTFLNQHYQLLLPRLGVEYYQDPSAETVTVRAYGASKRKILPRHLKTPLSPYEHMIAAIKHQGIRLHFFAAIFGRINVDEFTAFISAAPNSKHNRVLWHLYEWLTGRRLGLSDLTQGNYVDLFDDEFYFTLKEGWRDRRTRIRNNAIGTPEYCPTVRKTAAVKALAETNVYDTALAKMQQIGEELSADVLGRSINYLYTKETKSSNEIEHEKPDKRKMQRFLNAIKNAGLFELSKEKLIDLQNHIVAESARASDYRTGEIYVGSTIQHFSEMDQDVHYVGAPASQVPSMMNGLLKMHDQLMLDGQVPALIHATVVSFGEVYIHPFDDGNGRIHRYLIHDVMRQREPEQKFIIPISAAIFKNPKRYDEVLETISKPLVAMLDYHLDDQQRIVINNDIDYMYRFPDFTEHVIFVYEMMNVAISEELIEEVVLLIVFDTIKGNIGREADVPNQKLDTLVSILISGNGKASNSKRALFLRYLTEDQLRRAEEVTLVALNETRVSFNIDLPAIMNRKK